MLNPSLAFTILISVLVGSLAHLISGGKANRLLLNIVAALAGFVLGQAASQITSIDLLKMGPLNLLTGIGGTLLANIALAILWRRPMVESLDEEI